MLVTSGTTTTHRKRRNAWKIARLLSTKWLAPVCYGLPLLLHTTVCYKLCLMLCVCAYSNLCWQRVGGNHKWKIATVHYFFSVFAGTLTHSFTHLHISSWAATSANRQLTHTHTHSKIHSLSAIMFIMSVERHDRDGSAAKRVRHARKVICNIFKK